MNRFSLKPTERITKEKANWLTSRIFCLPCERDLFTRVADGLHLSPFNENESYPEDKMNSSLNELCSHVFKHSTELEPPSSHDQHTENTIPDYDQKLCGNHVFLFPLTSGRINY